MGIFAGAGHDSSDSTRERKTQKLKPIYSGTTSLRGLWILTHYSIDDPRETIEMQIKSVVVCGKGDAIVASVKKRSFFLTGFS